MVFLIGVLTVMLVLDCLFLILLVLIQLPKKDAGAGVAFGGAATDALFGAGTGNVLTKATKYATIMFFLLLLTVGVAQRSAFKKDGKDFQKAVEAASKEAPAGTTTSAPAVSTAPAGSTNLLTTTPQLLTNTNAAAVPSAATNAAPK